MTREEGMTRRRGSGMEEMRKRRQRKTKGKGSNDFGKRLDITFRNTAN